MEFCSADYMRELMKRVNEDQVFRGLEKTGRDATYTLVIEDEPESGVRESFRVGFSVVKGSIEDVWTEGNKSTQLTDLVLSGRYGVWYDLLRGALSLNDALLTRRLKLLGEVNQVFGPTVWMSGEALFGVSLTKAAARIVEIARTIPTEFHGKYHSAR